MSKLGKYGALAGLGQGLTFTADMLRQQWAEDAREAKRIAAEGRRESADIRAEGRLTERTIATEGRAEGREISREDRGEGREIDREDRGEGRQIDLENRGEGRQIRAEDRGEGRQIGLEARNLDTTVAAEQRAVQESVRQNTVEQANLATAHGLDLEADNNSSANTINESREETKYWTVTEGNNEISYRQTNGIVEKVNPQTNQWEVVREAGPQQASRASSYPNQSTLLRAAKEYADKKIDEISTVFGRDSTEFAEFGGSREDARQHYIDEFIARDRGQNTPGVSLDTPEAAPQAALPYTPEDRLRAVSTARALIAENVSRETVIQTLKDNFDFTDEEIAQLGI